ncbi:MAG: translation initiation factor eIF-1A [Candidatus Nanoarchaeia archaeon]|nr:translation initiation factor eIF-1A [Candidatus Haiyanarchaeum thermophilum]MCW1303142.1 translation initiation factor eIF-1A [Candidatus Haiyanarchaeum thermophilum]MCW1303807.1 translation initiation factor eIF-1A [Candidatus Haiyanarchaeum thermophilum]MCW1306577.1 translation initiation factor eIF-1A [Candidatus Haiyanarchaeum thermophilum]MCW1306990.1 translation initiation factor eIF-1A [Candidatus Haiyanarchaeum thermophilum]
MEKEKLRLPEDGEVFGVVKQTVGACRMYVKCDDDKIRLCRVPGHLTRKIWVKVGDVVIVKPWEAQGDERGDIVHKYTPTEVLWLKKKNLFKKIGDEI